MSLAQWNSHQQEQAKKWYFHISLDVVETIIALNQSFPTFWPSSPTSKLYAHFGPIMNNFSYSLASNTVNYLD